jgi:hypothetical protein
MDSAAVMARYGERLALIGDGSVTGCPLMPNRAKEASIDPADAERQVRIARAWLADPGPELH